MKQIEDKFREIVQPIITGQVNTIAPGQKSAIDSMFAPWFMRTRYRRLDAQDIQSFGIPGDDLTKRPVQKEPGRAVYFSTKRLTLDA